MSNAPAPKAPLVVRIVRAVYGFLAVVDLLVCILGVGVIVSGGSSEIGGPLIQGMVKVSEADAMTWVKWFIPLVIVIVVPLGMWMAICKRANRAWTAHSAILLLLIAGGVLQWLGIFRKNTSADPGATVLLVIVLYYWWNPEVKLWFDRRLQIATAEPSQE